MMVADADSGRRKAAGEVSHASATRLPSILLTVLGNVMRLRLPYLLTYQVLRNIPTSDYIDCG